jgi:hypothetical protein
VILNASLAWTTLVLTTAFAQIVIVIVILQVLVPEVVNEHVPNLAVRVHLLRQVDDAVFDDVGIDAADVICLVPTDNSIVAVDAFHLKLAQLVGFDRLASMLDERILNWEVDPQFSVRRVVEMTFELLKLVVVGIPLVFEHVKFGRGDRDFLAADKLHSCIWVLVAPGVDVAFLVRAKFALHYVLGGTGAS